MDIVNKIFDKFPSALKTIFDHNRYKTAALLVFTTIGGCAFLEPTVNSIKDPGKKVTRAELQTEYQVVLKYYEGALAELDRKDEVRMRTLGVIQGLGTTIPFPGAEVVTGLAGFLLALGGGVLDKSRVDKKLEEAKVSVVTLPQPTATLVD